MAHNVNKRKRDVTDIPNHRSAPGLAPDNDFTQQYINDDVDESADNGLDFSAVLAQSEADPSHVQRIQALARPGQSASDTATAALAHLLSQQADNGERTEAVDQTNAEGESSPSDLPPQGQNSVKPAVGSDEWHKVRRDNHKEVERRRRETINEGINELQKIVPGCEKNKGSILAQAVQFIKQLKLNESQNIEKWTLEKMLTEQAIAELSSTVDKLKTECTRAWSECEQWKKAAQKAGIHVDIDEKLDVNDE
ncbi:hypothetical protein AMS68_007046 [Peltaster fructicola]|uniref:BHLH domain-containing protein n=1 Tax=Peltaster fructicola TaxID=286661 RepID=A0A6H0Y3V3_9PEZI|nr:hypothetical protein AMS68_007046 [Peltaster fructicola]